MEFNSGSYNSHSINFGPAAQILLNLYGKPWPSAYPERFIDSSGDQRIANRVQLTSREKQIRNLLSLYNVPDEYEIETPQDTERYKDDYVTITINLDNQIYRFDAVIPGYEEDLELKVQDINIIDDGIEISIHNFKIEKVDVSL